MVQMFATFEHKLRLFSIQTFFAGISFSKYTFAANNIVAVTVSMTEVVEMQYCMLNFSRSVRRCSGQSAFYC